MKRVLIVAALMVPSIAGNAWHAQERRLAELGFSATPENIAKVVDGRNCIGPNGDTLKFRTPAFEHSGQSVATYQLGYSSVIIERGREQHSHVITVSPEEKVLYFSGGKYQC